MQKEVACFSYFDSENMPGKNSGKFVPPTSDHRVFNVIACRVVSVAERNLNPKVACLKRREEEKFEEMTSRSLNSSSTQDSQLHLSLHNNVSMSSLVFSE